jgi:hypothetical protein
VGPRHLKRAVEGDPRVKEIGSKGFNDLTSLHRLERLELLERFERLLYLKCARFAMVTMRPPAAVQAATRYIQKYPNDSTKLPQISAPTPLLRGRATENVAMALPLRSDLACSIAIARVVALAIAKPTM